MKALIVVNLAGFLTFLWNDISTLQEMGYDVEVAMNAKMADGTDAVEVDFLEEKNIPYHHIDFDTKSMFSKNNGKAYLQLRKVLKNRYDMVHCHTPIVGLLGRIAAAKYRRKGTKVIYTTHGFTFTDRSSKKSWMIYFMVENFASCFSDAIVTINHEDYKNARRMHCKNVYIIPSVGLNRQRFENITVDRDTYRAQFGIGPEDYMILAVGELSARKNHQVIIRAIAQMEEKDKYVFVIFGRAVTDSPIPGELTTLAEELGVRLVLAGHRLDIPEANACADVAVIPSLREGLGMAGLEALVSGVPVVGSDVQGIREYVKNEKTGYLCDPDHPEEFAKSLEILCHLDSEEKERLSRRCKKMAGRFDVEASKAKVRSIYEEILQENL